MSDLSAYIAFSYVPAGELLMRLAVATGLSFLLGLDREIRQKSFGLRTHILLCVGTAAFVLVMMEMMHSLVIQPDLVNVDPARVIQAVIIGIGFLSAGAIIRAQQHIIGATTGAGIWVLGAIGLACGFGLYLHAVLVTAIILFVIIGLHPLDRWLQAR